MSTLEELRRATAPDSRVQLEVMRSINQIQHALRNHGLMVVINPEGQFGVEPLPADVSIPGERIVDGLRRRIHEDARTNRRRTDLRLSHDSAHALARELVEFQLQPLATALEIYNSMVAGGAKFMDLKITVSG